jgi:SsrA-binding protein
VWEFPSLKFPIFEKFLDRGDKPHGARRKSLAAWEKVGNTRGLENGVPKPVKMIARNKKARHEYDILDTYEAGLSLLGSEVKSLRAGQATIKESFVQFKGKEAFLLRSNIQPYTHATHENHEATRPRKLLLNQRELKKLREGVREKGLTIVPLSLYFKGAWVKLEIGLARGRKLHDKRDNLKKKQAQRDISRGR